MSEPHEVDNKVIIYGIVEGPFHSDEIPDWEEDSCWMVVCQTEDPFGGIQIEELTFWTFDDALEVVDYFKRPHSGPFIMDSEGWEKV